MKPSLHNARLVLLASISMAATPAAAQNLTDLVPRREFNDQNGVDMSGPTHRFHEPLLSIGNGPRSLSVQLNLTSPGVQGYGPNDVGTLIHAGLSTHSYFAQTGNGIAWFTAVLPHQSGRFWWVTSGITPEDPGVSGTVDSTTFNYIGKDGTEAIFSRQRSGIPGAGIINIDSAAALITFPDGETWTYRYNDAQIGAPLGNGQISRVRSIVSSRGYALQFDYVGNPTGTITTTQGWRDFWSIARVTAYNKATTWCDETLLQSCATVTALPSAVTFSYGPGTATITKPNGETVQLGFTEYTSLNLTSITRPGMSRTMTYEDWTDQDYGSFSNVSSVTEAGRTWYYSKGLSYPGVWDTRRYEPSQTGPNSLGTNYRISGGVPYEIYDPLSRRTDVGYNRAWQQTYYRGPEGNTVQAQDDARGNIIWVRQTPKTGTGYLEATATFPSACTSSNRRTCNQPTSTTDFNSNATDYTYDPAHGGLLTETGPAVNGVRPQARHSYAQRYAWVSNGSGGYAQAATPVWVRTSTSSCRTSAATGNPSAPCATAGDEVLTQYDYGPNSGPNTLLLRGQTVTATDGGVTTTLRTCYGYDANGNRISETSPNANLTSCP